MDTRRPHYTAAAPPPPPHTPVDHRPPLPHFSQPPQPNHHPPQAPPHHLPYPGPPPPPGASGPSLPPIQQPYAAPGVAQDPQSLPPFRHPSQQPQEAREGEYQQYNQHTRSGHATPAPVNRSYSVDSSHQQRTPTTPAHPGPYPSVSAPDGAPPSQQPPMDHGSHPGYPPTNGVPHGLPPPHGSQHHPPPQPPPYHAPETPHHYSTPVMENHHPYSSQGQPMSYSQPYGPASTQYLNMQKRKQMRATQACEQCRQRKQKCDEGTPCSFCKEQSLSCQYRDTPPAKTDKNMEKILSYMESHGTAIASLAEKMDNFDSRLRRVEHGGGFHPAREPDTGTADEPPKRKVEIDDHRTAPHKLILLWPSVGPLLRHANVNVNDSYVMEAEDRGILRIFTRGEGIDEYDGTQPGGPASPARSEESSEGAPSPPDGLWGTGFPQTPNSDFRRSEPYTQGGLKPDGTLDLDITTINTLYDSYMKHLHIMHPFLDKARLRKLIDSFIKKYSPGHPNLRQKFAVGSGSDSERPLKRQRSNGSTATGVPVGETVQRKEPTERSPGNAIVWLVLALGKICLHKGPLPQTVPDGRPSTNNVISHQLTGIPGITGSSPITGALKPSPLSPRSATQPTPPSVDGIIRTESRSRRSSVDGAPVAGPRNMDVIPGLAYYAKAAEILGDQGDGNDLVHAQMFLLAGLYKGQLARVKESMSWIVMAGRACLMLLDRYKLYNDNYWTAFADIRRAHEKGQARIKDKRHSLIVLASWSCLQLESDILAEMRLPSSGIGTIENMLLMPHNMPEGEEESYDDIQQGQSSMQQDNSDKENYNDILMFYTAQMFLRKRLNTIHKEMYGDHCLKQPVTEVRQMLSGHGEILENWRESLPSALVWRDDDPPASDILQARLRGKYWGARYLINRPFLDYALHIMPHAKDGRSIESVAKDVNGNPRDPAEVQIFKAIELMGEQEIWQAVKRCIDAAMHSTIAFDGVGGPNDRLIMTNIHGTAHAQFGNMLVLSATFYNPYLKQLIEAERFQPLLERTIGFLRRLSAISPTCYHDCGILENISRLLFGNVPTDAKHLYRNEIEPSSASNSFGGHST